MQTLNFPYPPARLRKMEDHISVFDVVRKKWLVLTPEEWVRQHLILYLNKDKSCPLTLMAVEKALEFNGMKRRTDLVIHSNTGEALLLAECKAPGIAIGRDVFDQAARYNMTLEVPFLLVTNGLEHFCCRIDRKKQSFEFLKDIPTYEEMIATANMVNSMEG